MSAGTFPLPGGRSIIAETSIPSLRLTFVACACACEVLRTRMTARKYKNLGGMEGIALMRGLEFEMRGATRLAGWRPLD